MRAFSLNGTVLPVNHRCMKYVTMMEMVGMGCFLVANSKCSALFAAVDLQLLNIIYSSFNVVSLPTIYLLLMALSMHWILIKFFLCVSGHQWRLIVARRL